MDDDIGALDVAPGRALPTRRLLELVDALPPRIDLVALVDAREELAPADVDDAVSLTRAEHGPDLVLWVAPVTDAVKSVDHDGRILAAVDRTPLRWCGGALARRSLVERALAAAGGDEEIRPAEALVGLARRPVTRSR